MRRGRYPTKTSVNLLYKERKPYYAVKLAGAVLVFGVFLFLFTKYAVYNRLTHVWQEEDRAEAAEARVAALREANADYDEVLKEYLHYQYDAAEQGDVPPVALSEVRRLLEENLLYRSRVTYASLSGSVFSVQIADVDLNETSAMLDKLKQSPIVDSVSVSISNTNPSSSTAVVYMTITLKAKGEDGT